MAVPAVVGRPRSVDRPSGAATSSPLRLQGFGREYVWILLLLFVVAVLSRVYTTNSLLGEPTSDEYLYAVHARDLAREWVAGEAPSVTDLGEEGRSVAIESAALSLIIPWDPLTIGRTVQALLNALCIPMTFVLARA